MASCKLSCSAWISDLGDSNCLIVLLCSLAGIQIAIAACAKSDTGLPSNQSFYNIGNLPAMGRGWVIIK